MALEATHIRFALDVKKDFNVSNIKKYISGTVYPDSRYVTEIKRELTHDDKYQESNFYQNDDFKKGWAVHLLYDKIQKEVMLELFDDLLFATKQFNDNWIIRTALKIIQDIDDANKCNTKNYMQYLEHVESPNKENIRKIKKYNNIIIDLYSNNKVLTVQDLIDVWIKFGVSKDVVEEVFITTQELENNQSVTERMKKIYALTLKKYYDIYRKI